MGYVIGPDGKIYDDGKGPLSGLSGEPEMEQSMAPQVSIGEAIIESPGYAPGVASVEPEQRVIGPDGNILKTTDPYNYDAVVDLVGKEAYENAAAEYKRKNTLAEPFAGSSKVKYSEGGPLGIENVPGNADPYNTVYGSGSDDLMQAREGIKDSLRMSNEALDMQAEADAQNADISKREFAEQGLQAQREQDILKAGEQKVAERRIEKEKLRAQAYADSVKRVESWNREAEAAANTEVDPGRYWNNRSSFSKIAFALGALAGGMRTDGGANTAMEVLQTEIGRDIAVQSDKLARRMDYLKDKRGNIDVLNNLDRLRLSDFDSETESWMKEFDVRMQVALKEIDKTIAKFGQERVNPELLKLQAGILQGRANMLQTFHNMDMELANKKIDREFQANESAKTRRHQMAMAKQARAWELEDREREETLNALADQNAGWVPTETVGGFTVNADGTGQIGEVQLNPELTDKMKNDFYEKIGGLAGEYQALEALKDAWGNPTTWNEIVKASKEMNQTLAQALSARYSVTGKQVSDKEFDNQIKLLTGGTGNIDRLISSGNVLDVLQNNIDRNLAEGERLYGVYTKKHADGRRAVYKPQSTYRSSKAADTGADLDVLTAELTAEAGVENTVRNKPQNAIDPNKFSEDKINNMRAGIKQARERGDDKALEDFQNGLSAIYEKQTAEWKKNKGSKGAPDYALQELMKEANDALNDIRDPGWREGVELTEMEAFFKSNPGASIIDYQKSK